MIIGYSCGVFDLLHIGHINLLKNAKSMCDKLIVGLSTDECIKYKFKNTVIKYEDRKIILESIKYVDSVIPQTDTNKYEAWKKLKFNILFVGDDWYNTEKWNKFENKLNEYNVKQETSFTTELLHKHPNENYTKIGNYKYKNKYLFKVGNLLLTLDGLNLNTIQLNNIDISSPINVFEYGGNKIIQNFDSTEPGEKKLLDSLFAGKIIITDNNIPINLTVIKRRRRRRR